MNIIGFIKDWTLPISILMGIIIYVICANITFFNSFSEELSSTFNFLLLTCTFLTLFTTFCKVDFRKLTLVKWHFFVLISQVILSLLVVGIVLLFKFKNNSLILSEAILSIISCPCATAAAVVTSKLGGNLEEMTAFSFISNFVAAILIPAIYPLIEPGVNQTFIQAFLIIMYKVCIVLVLPMLFAYIVKHYLHSIHMFIINIKDLAYYIWAFALSIATGITVRNIAHSNTTILFLIIILLSSLVLSIMQFYLGRTIGKQFKAPIEAGQGFFQKNTSFAIWISHTYLNPLSSVGPGCYVLCQNLINSIELWIKRKQDKSLNNVQQSKL